MKFTKLAYTGSLLIVGLGLAVNGYSQSWLTNGLVAYWPFNGSANDASGNGHNGTVYRATLTTNRFGNANQAYLFGGTAYITVSLNSALFGTDFTASVWFNANDINNAWPALLEEVGNTAFVLAICGQTSGAGPQSIGNLFAYATHGGPNKDWELGIVPMFQPSLNEYYQAVVVRAGTNVTMYVNGGFLATDQIADPTVEPGNTFYIGNSGDGGGPSSDYTFHGIIDDIRMYNRALSSNEVAQLYAIESTPPAPPCSPHKATATAQLDNGFLVGAIITDPGCGYTNVPAVLIQGGGGDGATAVAVVSNGVVVRIIITDAGIGYTSTPMIAIASPPFVPTVSVAVSAVKVTQHVVLGRNYVLESSTDLVTWTATGPQFTAQAETIVNEFDVDVTGRFFRIRQVP